MKLRVLLFSSLMLLSAGTAWADVEINETNFPDESFRNWLLERDYGSDGKLTDEEIAGVTNINVSGTYGSPGTISSLKGIDYFTALTSLTCDRNQLTSLDVSKNTALTSLGCYSNQLTSLDVSKNTALTNLACSNNQLTSLDVSKNTALTLLWCFDNPLTSLDVSKNTALTSLDCDGNQLTSLDVSKNTALTKLSCDNNQLTSLDVSKNTALTILSCSSNQLTSLDVSKNTALTELYCYNNQLTSLDVSGCTALTKLVCDGNQLTSLDVSGCTALKTLSCAGNQLTSLDVSGNTALTRLYCYQNQIKGAAMDALVASLPKVMLGDIVIIYNEDEQNEMMSAQVTAAKAKGWKPWKYNGQEFVAYTGVLPPMPDLTPEELLKIDMISSDMPGWFVDKETKIQGSNVNVTKNINLAETKYKTGSIQTADGKTHPYSYFYVPAASTTNPNVGFYLPYNLKGEYDIYLVTMPTWTYQNNFDEEKRRYRFRASIWEKDEQNNFPSTGTALTVDGNNTFETPEVDANVITDTTFIGTYDFQHAYTDNLSPGVILQINPVVLSSQRKTYSNSMIFAGVVLVAKDVEPQTGIAINEENFPDENFRNYLLSQSFGSDGVLTNEEIAGETWIIVSYKSIQSLKGIEFFTALTLLDCRDNQLTSLDVSKNTALTELSCDANQLTSLDVSKHTALTKLVCGFNQLTSLDVSKNTALKQLVCSKNQLTTLDVSKNTALEWLYCYDNQLTSLDLSKNTALTELGCGDNQLTSLDVSKNTKLTWLSCGGNQLTSLDVSKNTALTELECGANQLTSLDVSKNTALTSLLCSDNQLTSLDVSKNTALRYLDCYQNQIKGAAMDALVASLPTVSNGSMRVIYYENEQNVMTTTQVAAAKAKGWIPYYTDNGYDWYEYAGVDPVLEGIAINETNFLDENFRNYLLEQDYGSDGKLTDAEIARVTSIDVPSMNIRSLKGIEYFTALTELWCFDNQLTSLDVSKNTKLTELYCSGNQLTSLDVSGCTALKQLVCSNNQLTSLDVSKNTALTELWCFDNQLTSLDVSKNTALTELECGTNQLTSLDVSKNTALTSLNCDGNQLTSLDVSKNAALTWLVCYNNQLASLDVSKNTVLTYLNCSGNQLTSLDVSKNTALTSLNCDGNQLTSLDVSKNAALTWLVCYQNQIKGEGMDALVASLPTVSNRSMYIIYFENEQNVMTTTQVSAAKAKGWKPYYTDGSSDIYGDLNWKVYSGVDPSTEVNNVEAADADDSAPWYTINGTLLSGKPTEKGIYIHGGKKVIVK